MKTIDRSSVNHSVDVMNLTIGASPLLGPHCSRAEDGCHCVPSISQLGNCCLYLGPEGVSFSISFPESLGMKNFITSCGFFSSRKGSSLIRARARYRDSSHAAESLPKLALDLITCRPLLGKKIRIPFLAIRIFFLLSSRQRHCVVTLVDRRIAFSSFLPRASILGVSFNNCLCCAHFAC